MASSARCYVVHLRSQAELESIAEQMLQEPESDENILNDKDCDLSHEVIFIELYFFLSERWITSKTRGMSFMCRREEENFSLIEM